MYTLVDAFELRPSRRLAGWLAAGVVLALVAIARAALPPAIQALLALVVIAAGYRGWQRTTVRTVLRLDRDGGLQVQRAGGEWEAAEVGRDSLVTRPLIVLRYRVAGRPVETRVILSDSAPPDALRCLRVSLRWARRTRSDTASPDAD